MNMILVTELGDLLTSLGLGISGSYAVLTMVVLIIVFIITYLFGREVFAILSTSLVAIGMSVWNGDINRMLLAFVAVIFGVLIVMLIYRVTNK